MASLLVAARGAPAPWLHVTGTVASLAGKMVGVSGIEPLTPSMSTKCSPAELYALNHTRVRVSAPCGSVYKRSWRGVQGLLPPRDWTTFHRQAAGVRDMTKSFILYDASDWTSRAVFSSPHCGASYPADFLASRPGSDDDPLVRGRLRRSPVRLGAAPGAPLLAATLPRAYVDLNRAPDELDPALIAGAQRRGANPRVAAGLGVIPRVVAEGRTIRAARSPCARRQRRISATTPITTSSRRCSTGSATPSAWRSCSTATPCRTTRWAPRRWCADGAPT